MYTEFNDLSIIKIVRKCTDIRAALIESGEVNDMHVKFSFGNSKTGALVPSVSTIPVADCGRGCKCCKGGCYDVRHDIIKPPVARSRAINSAIMRTDLNRYFTEISKSLFGFRFFRFHVGGDIISREYLEGVIRVAAGNAHCKVLIFTKSFEVVNTYVSEGGEIPENLIIVFSRWRNQPEFNNPYNFPVSYPKFTTGEIIPIPGNAKNCGGDCSACALSGCGCFNLKHGESVYFDAH